MTFYGKVFIFIIFDFCVMYVKISGRTEKINNFLILFFTVSPTFPLPPPLALSLSANMFFALNLAMALVNYNAATPRR